MIININKSLPEWNSTVEKYLVKSLDRLNSFLIEEYYPFTKDDKLGLSQYKGEKSI